MNILCLSVILLTFFTRISIAKRINTFIPQYCKPLKYNPDLNIETLSSSGNDSSLVVTAYLHEGLELTDDYECYVIVRAPENYGIVTTVKKISFHDNDKLVFQRSSNTDNDVWLQQDENNKYKEILSLPQERGESSIRMRFKPSIKRSEHMAGFEIAFTSYRVKGDDTCGEDFDCGNDRCVSPELTCDSYNNCGNDADESGCAGVGNGSGYKVYNVVCALVYMLVFDQVHRQRIYHH